MTIDELRREVMRLDPTDRARLAHDILVSLDALSEADVESLWLREAERRRLDSETGTAKLVPAHEAFTRLRAKRTA